jgi:hypothetical protein
LPKYLSLVPGTKHTDRNIVTVYEPVVVQEENSVSGMLEDSTQLGLTLSHGGLGLFPPGHIKENAHFPTVGQNNRSQFNLLCRPILTGYPKGHGTARPC